MKLKAKKIERKYIELHGQIGGFDIEGKKTKVKYFSTFASGENKHHDSFELLKELKPMRERAKANELSNLDSMLQRDLNDYRVANELIPYLTDSPVAFFPAILAVLIPKGFISQIEDTEFPMPSRIEKKGENTIVNYEDKWKLEIFNIGEEESSLGSLSIDVDSVDIIVLDGQHRANAFRVVSGTFDDVKNSIYSSFYKDISPVSNFNADLPVTIMWFDNDQPKFDPRIISRRLFVDVNNTAKKVSRSRTILLDEFEVPSLLTRFFYSDLAEKRRFTTNKLSIFHSDFDLNSDINVSSNNVFSITNPQIVYDIFSWITLGNTERYYAADCYNVGREAFRKSLDRFDNIFNESDFDSNQIYFDEESVNGKQVRIKDAYTINGFQEAYNLVLGDVILNLFGKFNLYQNHFIASKEIENSIASMDHIETSVWEEVFMGGEGLYYTFKDQNLKDKKESGLQKYLSAINSIEKKFKTKRSELFYPLEESKINQAFNSANSKAFQIALFMALDAYVGWDNTLIDLHDEFINIINTKTDRDWIYILTDIRQKVLKGTDPKKWPAYQKIILRAIQNNEFTIYDSDNYLDSPDGIVFKDNINTLLNSWLEVNSEILIEEMSIASIDTKVLSRWISEAKRNTEELFLLANIHPIEDVDYEKYGKAIINQFITKWKN